MIDVDVGVAADPRDVAAGLRRRAVRELEQLEDDPDRDPDRAARLVLEYRRAARIARGAGVIDGTPDRSCPPRRVG